jgi:Gnt-I system low-affinity gluconate transporter
MTTEWQLILAIIIGISFLLFLIIKVRLNAFLSLLISSVLIALMSGINPTEIAAIVSKGMGDTLAFVATIVGLGAIFGAILEHSGGARQIAAYMVRKTGDQNSRVAVLFSGFIIAIPVFFDVAFIILFPIIQALRKRLKKPLLYFALPLITGIAITHSFIPPTPGPVAVADILKVDLGWMILLGIPIGIPVAIIGGLIIAKKLSFETKQDKEEQIEEAEDDLASFQFNAKLVRTAHLAILIPILLMILSAVLKTLVDVGTIQAFNGYDFLLFIGHPFSALIIATLFALYFLGTRMGLDREQLFKISNDSLAPAGTIILITGAGGVLKQTLITTGIGAMIAEQMNASGMSVLLLAYLIAVLVRVLQGSATISMITAAGITAPILELMPGVTMPEKTLLALAIASGSIIASHVNDSGFWIVNRFLKHEVTETLRSVTILSTANSILAFLVILLFSMFI